LKRLAILLAACGSDPETHVDAPPPDAFVACSAQLTGNFAETITSGEPCAALGESGLTVQLPSMNFVEPYTITFGIGNVAGDYSAQTVTTWSSQATRMLAHDMCILAAGDQAVPHGDFTLHLDSVVPAHGTLSLDQPVHATAFSDCGDPLVEHFEVTF
jgi:hypothetical protein